MRTADKRYFFAIRRNAYPTLGLDDDSLGDAAEDRFAVNVRLSLFRGLPAGEIDILAVRREREAKIGEVGRWNKLRIVGRPRLHYPQALLPSVSARIHDRFAI